MDSWFSLELPSVEYSRWKVLEMFFKGEMVLVVLAATQCPVLQREMKL